tara:strand:+ start:480 stop:905 length:426 start_codon:yes stop_codon:yes gene_type:complete
MKTRKIPRAKVRMLASFGCSFVEIAKYFACDEARIRQKFRDAYEQGRQDMKLKIRQAQLKSALEHGSQALLIWLGKNYLNQSDKADTEAVNNLETVLRACGFEENKIGKTDTEQGEVVELLRVSADSSTESSSRLDSTLPN